MKSITRITGLFTAFLIPAFASAAWSFSFSIGSGSTCGTYIECLGGYVIYIINGVLVPVLFAVAFIVFLWGVAQAYIFSKGDEAAVGKGHKLMLWGLIGFAVMVSVWGLVNVVVNTFGLWGYSAPPLPNSYTN
ncbi:MAG: hypothetical protein NTY93_03005 [Candidatus Kaiserbacteria bacterium]|nr:hypothetical protein [Candidatus Kaiserbacteria bacterium]